ncbi:MAG: class I SAM-dependent methyltransferase [Planctomycetota bacterium]
MDREWVERYHRKQTGTRTAQRRLRREHRIVRALLGPLGPGAVVLDVPCGIGPHTRRLQEEGLRVIACDRNRWMLEHALRDARPWRLLQADARRLPLASDVADAALVIRLLHYLDDPAERRAVLSEAARVARGPVVISFMHPIAVAPLLKARPTRKTQDVATIRRDAEACGLRVARLRPVFPFVKRIWFAALERR